MTAVTTMSTRGTLLGGVATRLLEYMAMRAPSETHIEMMKPFIETLASPAPDREVVIRNAVIDFTWPNTDLCGALPVHVSKEDGVHINGIFLRAHNDIAALFPDPDMDKVFEIQQRAEDELVATGATLHVIRAAMALSQSVNFAFVNSTKKGIPHVAPT